MITFVKLDISNWAQTCLAYLSMLFPSKVVCSVEDQGHTPPALLVKTKGTPPGKKNVFFQALPKFPLPPPSPQFGQLVQLFRPSKRNI